MKITIRNLKEMRDEDMPIILQDCKYTMGYAQTPISGPWGWMVHCGDCDAMADNDHIECNSMGFHFLYDGLDFVEVDTSDVTIDSDGIYVSKPTIWVEEDDVVDASTWDKYVVKKALGDGYNVRQWNGSIGMKWYPTFEDAKYHCDELNGYYD